VLDDESKFPQGDDQSFVDKLIKNFAKRPEFKTPKGQSLEFSIQHFAGQASIVTLLLKVKHIHNTTVYNIMVKSCNIVYRIIIEIFTSGFMPDV